MTRRTRSFLASRALSSGGWGLGRPWALVGVDCWRCYSVARVLIWGVVSSHGL